ncbi:MAG: GntR family transcriptional regulator [Rhodospirillales bacterium]|nr:GntR family transcriptional regulator [Rhodospirillales bacterium]
MNRIISLAKKPRKRAGSARAADKAKDTPRRVSRVESLLKNLEADILRGTYAPGDRLDEQQLARRFKVSRTPVREALRHLASAGLIEMRRHQGAIVKQLTIAELIEMFQVMAELEGLCARLAARRIGAKERVRLRRFHDLCKECLGRSDHEKFFEANNDFHEVIFQASRNSFLIEQAAALRKRLNPYRRYITYQPGRMIRSVNEHDLVVRAIEGGDSEAAHRLMRDHINMLGEDASDFIVTLSGFVQSPIRAAR